MKAKNKSQFKTKKTKDHLENIIDDKNDLKSSYGYNFDYNSETSDEEKKYIDYKNNQFYQFKRKL
jgi:hypothetical protein